MNWSDTIFLKFPSQAAWQGIEAQMPNEREFIAVPVDVLNVNEEYFLNARCKGDVPEALEPFIQPVPEHPKMDFA